MSSQIQFRRGSTVQTTTFTGALAEVTVDTDKKTLVIHDGATAGGNPLASLGANTFTGAQTFSGSVSGITKTTVGLNNVDNTSDDNKPVSAATQTALNLKATLASTNSFTALNTFSTLSLVAIDKGNSGVSTQTFDYSAGGHQKLTITGATTIAFSNFPATGRGELLIELVNGAAFTITWPVINFMKTDGTFTTSIATYLTANTGRTALKTSGTDFLLVFSQDAGTTLYGKLL